MYRTEQPFDPEGVLGTINSVVMGFLGMQVSWTSGFSNMKTINNKFVAEASNCAFRRTAAQRTRTEVLVLRPESLMGSVPLRTVGSVGTCFAKAAPLLNSQWWWGWGGSEPVSHRALDNTPGVRCPPPVFDQANALS